MKQIIQNYKIVGKGGQATFWVSLNYVVHLVCLVQRKKELAILQTLSWPFLTSFLSQHYINGPARLKAKRSK
jgi:hypothetical protein